MRIKTIHKEINKINYLMLVVVKQSTMVLKALMGQFSRYVSQITKHLSIKFSKQIIWTAKLK